MSDRPTDATIAEALGITVEELHSWPREIGEGFLPVLLLEMLRRGLIDLDRLHDPQYVLSVLRTHSGTVLCDLTFMVECHHHFLEYAETAVEAGHLDIAVVMVATAVEHLLNMYYREILSLRHLPPSQVREAIRTTNSRSKVGWLMSLTGHSRFCPELRKRIIGLVDLRNAIVHYKAEPAILDVSGGSHGRIRDSLQNLDAAGLLSIPAELDETLEAALDSQDCNRALAKQIAATLVGRVTWSWPAELGSAE